MNEMTGFLVYSGLLLLAGICIGVALVWMRRSDE